VLGWVIIFKQAGILFDPPAQANETLIWMAAGLLGAPGVLQLWQARSGVGTSTAEPGRQPPLSESSPSSPGAP
jgi:hypothetical protein